MVALVLGQELGPLQDPKDGWSSNYGFWIRTSVLECVGIPTLTVQATYFINGVRIPTIRLILLSIVASVAVITSSMAICAHLVFPVPFFLLAMFPVLSVVLAVSFRVIIGRRIIHDILAHHGQLTRYLYFVNAKCLLIFVYPAYEALFHAAHGTRYQVFVILLMPVIKIALKSIMRRRTAHMEGMTPEAVIFTVDLFNSTYMATCMQSASSLLTVTVISAIDLSLTITMLYGLHRRTATTVARLRNAVGNSNESNNVLGALCLLCRSPEKLKNQARGGINVYSHLPYKLAAVDLTLLSTISSEGMPKPDTSKKLSASTSPTVADILSLGTSRDSTIYPLTSSVVGPTTSTWMRAVRPIGRGVSIPCRTDSRLLQESLETLFTMGCLVIASYLEAIISLFYASYILVVHNCRQRRGNGPPGLRVWVSASCVVGFTVDADQAELRDAGAVSARIRDGDTDASNSGQADVLDAAYLLLPACAFRR
ncbi:hypothetical protein ON010_g2740 [Phytophthora cinnamomi]|nr:hypothetical protein ON010_g2740 [Phytophthora cinnamomi]